MKVDDIFKAIKLRVKISKPYLKDFYGDGCREFVFEDFLGNNIGVFIVNPHAEVCEVIVNAIIQNNLISSEQKETVAFYWVNPLIIINREFILQEKSSLDRVIDIDVNKSLYYEHIENESIILSIVCCVISGKKYIINNSNELNNKVLEDFLEKHIDKKDSFKKSSIDVKDLKILSFKDSFYILGSKVVCDSELPVVKWKVDVNNEYEKISNYEVEDNKSVFLELNEISDVLLPAFLNGSFDIGKGFSHVNELKLIKKSDLKSKVINNNKFSFENSSENNRKVLKDKVLAVNIIGSSSDIQKNHIHRYPGEKTVLSNLKPISND